jgi:peptide/nickel transport system permease protein
MSESGLPGRHGWNQGVWSEQHSAVRTLIRDVVTMLRTLKKNKGAMFGALILLALVVAIVFGRWIEPYGSTTVEVGQPLAGPSWKYLFGTDQYGRDILSRVIAGATPAGEVALFSVAIGLAGGVAIGLAAGLRRRVVDPSLMRLMDVLLAFPSLLLALLVVSYLGTGLTSIEIAIGVTFVPIFARTTRGAVRAEVEKPYILGAQLMGCSTPRLIRKHLWPNIFDTVVVMATSAAGWAVATGAGLDFLALGVQPPRADWGADLGQARSFIMFAWWPSVFPGVALALVVLAFNLLGDGLGDLFDPRLKHRPTASPPGPAATIQTGTAVAHAADLRYGPEL